MLTIKEISVESGFDSRDRYLSNAYNNYEKDRLLEEAELIVSEVVNVEETFEAANALTCAGALFWFAGEVEKAYKLLKVATTSDEKKGYLPELLVWCIEIGKEPKDIADCFVLE
jgi:hypothetical protein